MLNEEEEQAMDEEIKAARTKSAAKEFDQWLDSVEQRLSLMADEVGADIALRKILAMQMLSHVTELMKVEVTVH